MINDPSNPYSPPTTSEGMAPTGPTDYHSVPLLRRHGFCSTVIFSHVILIFLGACIPFLGLIGLFTTIGVIVVCVTVLTGPVYYNRTGLDGRLAQWSQANKVAAVILLFLFVAGYGVLMYLAWIQHTMRR